MDSKKLTKFIAELHKNRNPISASEIQQLAAKHSITRSIATIMRKAGYANRQQNQSQKTQTKTMNQINLKTYKFTNLNHGQILQIIEEYRIKNDLTKAEISRRAGYSDTQYNQVLNRTNFSKKSFNAFMNLCNAETEKNLFSAINKRIEENPNANHIETAIQLLKSTGKYKILELQQTWNEL